MIAYNNEWLNNGYTRQEADDVFDAHCITKEECDNIYKKYPVQFYTPNIFIRIGLFILTVIIMFFSLGLMALIFYNASNNMLANISIIFGIVSYVFLEFMVRSKKHYRSGVDDALLWGSFIAVFCGIFFTNEPGDLVNCIIILMFACYGMVRFADRLMAVVAYLSMLGILFYTCIEFGNLGKNMAPFVLMAASLLVYFATKKFRHGKKAVHYGGCLDMIGIVSLVGFYAAGNYFVVREISNEMFQLHLQPIQTIPFGWLFWLFTVSIPVIYIAIGLRKKDPVLIRIGILLVAAIVFTIRYYHSILPVETIMTLSGILLIGIGYGLMKWLHEPKYGFTYQQLSKKNAMDKLNIESLVIAQTFMPGTETNDTKFGGGSFGGGGTSGEY